MTIRKVSGPGYVAELDAKGNLQCPAMTTREHALTYLAILFHKRFKLSECSAELVTPDMGFLMFKLPRKKVAA